MSCVLLIRPLDDIVPMEVLLKSKGITCCHYPLFKPLFLPIPPLTNPQALIITSKNAIRALEGYKEFLQIPIFTVGDKTAAFAKQKGFLKVTSASGTSQELISLILTTVERNKGVLWHLSGEQIKGNIAESLKRAGFDIKRQIVYRIEDAVDFPPLLHDKLKNDVISHIIFCSPRTTNIFVNLLKKNDLEKNTCKIIALCLSQGIKEETLNLTWKRVWVSPKPSINHLMGYFDGKE